MNGSRIEDRFVEKSNSKVSKLHFDVRKLTFLQGELNGAFFRNPKEINTIKKELQDMKMT